MNQPHIIGIISKAQAMRIQDMLNRIDIGDIDVDEVDRVEFFEEVIDAHDDDEFGDLRLRFLKYVNRLITMEYRSKIDVDEYQAVTYCLQQVLVDFRNLKPMNPAVVDLPDQIIKA